MKVLIVDDENVSRKKMEIILRAFGSFISVDSGTAAVAAFEYALEVRQPFGLICLDVSMPGMSGDEALKKIRSIEMKKNIPVGSQAKVIMVTGMADRTTVTKCKGKGCDNFIVKPFTKDVFVAKLRTLGIFPVDHTSL